MNTPSNKDVLPATSLQDSVETGSPSLSWTEGTVYLLMYGSV